MITFHNGQWPHFQLAFLALFSVGVNRGRQSQLQARRPAQGSLQPGRFVRHPPGRLESQGTAPDPASNRLPGGRGGGQKVLEELVKAAARPETNRLYRTVCRWLKEIKVLIITGAKTGKVEANNTAIKNIKRTARGYRNAANYKSVILLRSAVRTAA
ncbi:transposase [Pseudarthrobacter equi]|uniref:transposase n=1 Tax=Pseudarthrobacter equi TaxID=728066 RepID=UPI0012FDA717|nr:transposase [Pseudarthrobacter equi]